ncbi:MAG: pyruvate kinase [Pirellulales bacterium]|nr:pyruvate kinase [Pirellulales bacterium]
MSPLLGAALNSLDDVRSRLASRSVYARSRTKIVATIGPACAREDQLAELVEAGVDVFRLNMAHGSQASHAAEIEAIRRVSDQIGRPVAILVDLAGPKMRLGELPGGEVDCVEGAEFRFVRGQVANDPHELTTTYDRLIDELAVDDRIMLADGTVSLTVVSRDRDYAVCRVVQAGRVRSRQGVNLPGVKLSVPAMTKADYQNAQWAVEHEVDYISLSFVRTADDVSALKALVRANEGNARVIAKIEKPEALEHLEEIVLASDAIMIARGDLGVEIDIARVPVAQKRIIAMCNRLQKPVITATQMLDSMQHSRYPTRAETTDVANAILDGTDACMLSGETAIGDYPKAAVEMMQRIARETEPLLRERGPVPMPTGVVEGLHRVTPAVIFGASKMTDMLGAKLVLVASHNGGTALAMSKLRNQVPTIGISDSPSTLRRQCLYWGVTPLPGVPTHDPRMLLEYVEDWAVRNGTLKKGDCVLVITGTRLTQAGHNLLMVHEIS